MNKNYEFVRIMEEDAQFFRSLDPFEKLNLLSMPAGFAIGVLDRKDEESLIPIGLLVGTASEELITIEWLVVEGDYRFQGIGEELVVSVYEMAEAGNIPNAAVILSPEYEKEELTRNARSYFEERLFEKEHTIGADSYCQIIDLLESDYIAKGDDPDAQTLAFSQMTGEQKRQSLEKLEMMDNGIYSYPVSVFASRLEEDLSFMSQKSGKTNAALLVTGVGKDLLPVYYYSKSQEDGRSAICSSVKAAASKYGKGRGVMFLMRQPETPEILERVLGPQEKGLMLMADVSDYTNMEE